MLSKRNLISAAAVFLALLFLVPQSQIAQENALNTEKVSAVVRDMVDQAGPNELVTVIVKMADQASFQGIEGQRAPVFAALRQTATRSQANLVNSLKAPEKIGKIGVIRQFWIDNLVLVQATKDVITEIANRRDVLLVFENYTVIDVSISICSVVVDLTCHRGSRSGCQIVDGDIFQLILPKANIVVEFEPAI